MRQTGLALRHPGLIDTVAITDQDTVPIVNEGQERLGGATRIDAIESGLWRGHDPEPLEVALTKPGRFINIAHWGLACDTGNGCIVGLEGQCDAVDDVLDSPQTDGEAEHRGTECLDEGATGALHPRHFTNEGAEPGAISSAMRRWQVRLDALATAQTDCLRQDPMGDVHVDRR